MRSNATPIESAMVRRETIANTVATAAIAAVLSWAIFRGQSVILAFAGPPGGLFGILPGTFNFTLLVTIVLTLITRRRVAAGRYRRLGPTEGSTVGRSLPANVILRGLVLGAVATVVFVSVGAGAVWAAIGAGLAPNAWSFAGMLAYFVLYFVALSWVVTPIVVWRALRD